MVALAVAGSALGAYRTLIARLFSLAAPGGAQAVGMDVYQFNAAGDVILETFGESGLLGTTRVETDQAGAFFGVESFGEPITQIRVDDTDILPGIDDVAFVPEPASLSLGLASLAALAGAARLRTRAT